MPDAGLQSGLRSFFAIYDPGEAGKADALASKYAADEAALGAKLDTKYSCEYFASRREALQILKQHDPQRAGQVDALLSQHPKKEAALVESLRQKHGVAGGQTDWKLAVQTFYTAYSPSDVGKVDGLLTKYRGREADLAASLDKKYGKNFFATRQRALAILQAHDPSKAGSVDKLLVSQLSQGNTEQAVIDRLVKKYGDVPSGGGGGSDWKSRLTRFYEAYDPGKVGQVDKVLGKFAGREAEMMAKLVEKYGPEPGGGGAASELPLKARIARYYFRKLPDKVGSLAGLLAKYQGKEQSLYDALQKKHGADADPAGPPDPKDVGLRIVNMYAFHAPADMSALTDILERPRGEQKAVLKELVGKFGAEPVVQGDTRTWKDRLAAFYQKYCPEKVATVDATIAKYAGREAAMMAKLVEKFGPEPPPPSSLHFVDRVLLILAKHAPGRLSEAEDMVRSHRDKPGELMAELEKLGPEPDPDEEPPEGANPRYAQVRQDADEWDGVGEEQRSGLDEERFARWRGEDEESAARFHLGRGGAAAQTEALKVAALRVVAEGSKLRIQRLYLRRWLAWLKQVIDNVLHAHMVECDKKMSVYDQLQTNRWSLSWMQRMEAAQSRPAAWNKGCTPRQQPRPGSSRVARPPSPSAGVSRRRTSSVTRTAPRTTAPASAITSPAARASLRRYAKKWAPPNPRLTEPRNHPPARTLHVDAQLPPVSSPDGQWGLQGLAEWDGGSGRALDDESAGNGIEDRHRGMVSAAVRRIEAECRPDGELFARALQASTGTPANAVERALQGLPRRAPQPSASSAAQRVAAARAERHGLAQRRPTPPEASLLLGQRGSALRDAIAEASPPPSPPAHSGGLVTPPPDDAPLTGYDSPPPRARAPW
eukprot:TRINITY_DN5449_c1_g1_i1.p1 TRINITY_DN5449_c1_g1~~TRINITY_DN5449_c1_g1_i1.p1  ORF type:complete len:895 (+),score=251.16 TRINITY_DN5449_c1_g1_i1:44-2686(+)